MIYVLEIQLPDGSWVFKYKSRDRSRLEAVGANNFKVYTVYQIADENLIKNVPEWSSNDV